MGCARARQITVVTCVQEQDSSFCIGPGHCLCKRERKRCRRCRRRFVCQLPTTHGAR